MSDREMRDLLNEIISDLASGKLRVRRPSSRLGRIAGPPLLALSLGLGMAACEGNPVGTVRDATVEDAMSMADAAYMAPFDAQATDADPILPYMAPFDAGPMPEYMGPFEDAGVQDDAGEYEDAGEMPLYMGPPPTP